MFRIRLRVLPEGPADGSNHGDRIMDRIMDRILNSFRKQADWCRRLGSPFNGFICDLLAEILDPGSRFGQRILSWPGDAESDALALRAAASFHALARSGNAAYLTDAYPPHQTSPDEIRKAIEKAIDEQDDFLHDYLDNPPQTNEVARSAAILGGCLLIAEQTRLPLALFELGASAGLNLCFDRYRFELGETDPRGTDPGGTVWGNPQAAVVVRSSWQGDFPPLNAPLAVAQRAGCDTNPLDPGSPRDRERLLSYIWPDQINRLSLTERALDEASAAPWRVERADAAAWVEDSLAAHTNPDQTRVLLNTIVWRYLPEETRQRIRSSVDRFAEQATQRSPLAWLRIEDGESAEGADIRLNVWPGGQDRSLGLADFHGRWVKWAIGGS
jgi:hypothetical protein